MINGFNIARNGSNPMPAQLSLKATAVKCFGRVPTGAIKLVVTSPPYNLGKEYESRLHLKDYISQQREVIVECVRVLNDRGSICWQVGNYVDDGAIIPP